jgi:hypothetical protein
MYGLLLLHAVHGVLNLVRLAFIRNYDTDNFVAILSVL